MGRRKKLKKEELAEDWCFVCKDGGSLRICDYKDCLKSYHPECVNKDDSLLKSKDQWACGWHFCTECNKAPKFHCFCCPSAVCGNCLFDSGFAVVRGNKGLCDHCLELVLLIEGKKDTNLNGGKIDFYDEDTVEFYFNGYWQIVKEKAGLTSEHIVAAYNLLKKGKNHWSSDDSYGCDEEQENFDDFEIESQSNVSDYDDLSNTKDHKKDGKRKRSMKTLSSDKKKASSKKASSKKKEFIGWGSKTLLDFLASIGKDTTCELSQYDITNIVTEYCKENQLFHPERKKTIICDARLKPLLGRKTVNRNSVYNRLSHHLAENVDQSEDESGSSSENLEESDSVVARRKQKSRSVKKSKCKEVVTDVQKSCFASLVPNNINLLYLRRGLVEELAKQLETFDTKVIGSFVRVKSDPHDYLQRNSHQLVQVIDIKRTSSMKSEILLQVSNVVKEVPISKLSDDDFSEEECEDLRSRVKNGLLKRPTLVEFEQKARSLHEDKTKHWIARELVSLQKRIDRANEKGWRRELAEYMDSLLLLQTPSEQSRLLNEVPKVIADIVELESACEEATEKEQDRNDGSPETSPRRTLNNLGSNLKGNGNECCLNNLTVTTGGGDTSNEDVASGPTVFGTSDKNDGSGEAFNKSSSQKDTKGMVAKGESQSITTNEQKHKEESHNMTTGLLHACQVSILQSPAQQPSGDEVQCFAEESFVNDGSSDSKKRGRETNEDDAQGHGQTSETNNESESNKRARFDESNELELAVKDLQALHLAVKDMHEGLKQLRDQVLLTML